MRLGWSIVRAAGWSFCSWFVVGWRLGAVRLE